MESIGQKLISAREALGYSVEQIARETNIAKSYLTALESEDYDSFPGETYLLGFLRNYSEFLSLNPEEMISLYRNIKIQEQPAPMEELLVPRKTISGGAVAAIIIVLVLALGAAGYFYVYPKFFAPGEAAGEKPAAVQEEPEAPARLNIKNTYNFSDEGLEKRFRKNEAVSISLNDEEHLVVISEVGESAVFIHPQGELRMKAGEEAMLDLDGDDSADIRMLLRSLDPGNNSVVLHIDRFVQSAAPGKTEITESTPAAESAAAPAAAEAGAPGAPSREVAAFVVREAERPESFNLNVIFRGYCLLRYEADSAGREERYFHKSETFRLDVNSKVRIWASNAGAMSAKINGVDIDFGDSGEITARDISWVYNSESTRYELQMTAVY